jgi:aspartyl-tRNA synthetase
MELTGGSVQIHQPQLEEYVFNGILKIPHNVVGDRFGYILKAFEFGARPHGGINSALTD